MKKTLCLLLCAALLCTLCAGCGARRGAPTQSETPQETESEFESDSAPTETENPMRAALRRQLAENHERVADLVGRLPGALSPLTPEQMDQLASGELSGEEAMDTVLEEGQQRPDRTSIRSAEELEQALDTALRGAEGQARMRELVALIYLLWADSLSMLNDLRGQAEAEFHALPAGRDVADILRIGEKYAAAALEKERQTDEDMDAILAELRVILELADADASLVEEMRDAYAREKELQRSYFVSLYTDPDLGG